MEGSKGGGIEEVSRPFSCDVIVGVLMGRMIEQAKSTAANVADRQNLGK